MKYEKMVVLIAQKIFFSLSKFKIINVILDVGTMSRIRDLGKDRYK